MIIGLSGRMGSGKDTVGKIIQYLLCNNTGGVELEDITSSEDHNWWLEEQSGFGTKKFAGKLKQIGSILSGVPVEKFEDQEFKKKTMSLDWIQPKHYNCENYDELDGGNCSYCSCKEKEMTYREFLQKLGTEAMRDGLHTNVWVNALFADYKEDEGYTYPVELLGKTNKNPDVILPGKSKETFKVKILGNPEKFNNGYPNWVITDMRFPNELEAVVEKGGLTIRVTRDNGTRAIDIDPHPSETSLDNSTFDYEIVNDGTIKELAEKVQIILIKEGLL